MPGWPNDKPAVWPPRPTWEQLEVAGLSSDGWTVKGWIKVPSGVWEPDEGDVLWHPPNAAKSTDVDRAGSIADVVIMGDTAWLTSQLDKRNRYIDHIREQIRSGAMKLNAILAKWLGLPWVEDGAEITRRTGPVYSQVAAKALREEGQRLIRSTGMRFDPDTGLPILPGR